MYDLVKETFVSVILSQHIYNKAEDYNSITEKAHIHV